MVVASDSFVAGQIALVAGGSSQNMQRHDALTIFFWLEHIPESWSWKSPDFGR